ncbi:MAG: non-heme iron oxygenase ferredoxin subunit [Bifidobacteriaceae bacterium]|jgi:3-phenylpropionate/trans-cinnamate dioxygenase ferredoxin subunit|nr:non-heme iron oxygenase ferredoxin subunit [Bifidobacteriaceae bacterium]
MTTLSIAAAGEIGPGDLKSVQVRLGSDPGVVGPPQEQGPPGTTAIVVVHTEGGEWYAIGDVCSHGPVLLSEGEFDGCTLECWGHGSRFDLATGEPQNLPANRPVATYPVRVEDGQVLIDLGVACSAGGAGAGRADGIGNLGGTDGPDGIGGLAGAGGAEEGEG